MLGYPGTQNGAWRSLVAHHTGGVVVVGSNPAVPTIFCNDKKLINMKKFEGKLCVF